MAWADKYRKLKVRTNADTPRDAKKAHELGAEGIGLCRTEHMFFEEERIQNLLIFPLFDSRVLNPPIGTLELPVQNNRKLLKSF